MMAKNLPTLQIFFLKFCPIFAQFGNISWFWKSLKGSYKTIHFVIKEFHTDPEKINEDYEFPLSYGCLSCSIQLPIKFVRFVDPENSIGLDKTAKYAVSFD